MIREVLEELYNKKGNFIEKESRLIAEKAAPEVKPLRPNSGNLMELIGEEDVFSDKIGPHPDFQDLDGNEKIKHYIVSAFCDIKGSTLLTKKLSLEEVWLIKNAVLSSMIDIIQAFQGHVHRLQGDAILAFFGGKKFKKSDAIINAINASAFLQFYINNILSEKFISNDLPKMKIRIGLDFGNDNEVQWAHYGIQNIDEITTTSFSTDIAARLESRASSKKIMIGESINKYLDLPEEFLNVKTKIVDGEEVDDRYIMNNDYITYKMWEFDWESYLDYFSLIEKPQKSDISLKCFYKKKSENDFTNEYKSNCGALSKNLKLKHEVELSPELESINCDEIIWTVNNRGDEAEDENKTNFKVNSCKRKKYAITTTEFTGHHYMNCKIKKEGRLKAENDFGVFVHSD
ncbi:nucleotide-binding domain-containing protein [Halarsenatibacter silvermanii]|uniref:Adenylate and Guanylate cyclase catalytic domain-containing protein n=1 Tax=Halarsenatibacter silvermanii TaxID=321763 RepID=A0A1G9RC22_9FIRM|nr:adenylate/guanylate cyclase domain-containing protein [Halarsenatibacter silvermanii]SDM20417.1 Adenylate and Guanylate cyclase catalytic domain-containing protein [Halarsenatibacter silvermanii]